MALQDSGLKRSLLSASKKRKTEDETDSEEDIEEPNELETDLVQLSEAASAFIKATFKSKLDNPTRKSKATKFGIPNSQWLRCPKIDFVVFANVSVEARKMDRSASRLQQFWLEATNPLVHALEKAEELQLPLEAIGAIQTLLQLIGNACQHNSIARRNVLLLHLNPQLKQLVNDTDFKEAPFSYLEKTLGPWLRNDLTLLQH